MISIFSHALLAISTSQSFQQILIECLLDMRHTVLSSEERMVNKKEKDHRSYISVGKNITNMLHVNDDSDKCFEKERG